MCNKKMYPVKLKPVFKDYIWGGTRLKELFNKESDMDILAESWELSCHKNGESVVCEGEYSGKTLNEYINICEKYALGTNSEKFDRFPVLIKLIDAKGNLSIQVHPDDEYSLKNENQYGKTEMWYIADCDEGAYLYYGFNRDVTKEEFIEKINNNTILEVLNKVYVKKGDVFFIAPGTLHAIGAGIVIAEIQQNSDVTYRVYDYGRVDAGGNPRELHVEKAAEVTRYSAENENAKSFDAQNNDGYSRTNLASCYYFTVDKLDIESRAELNVNKNSFASLLCLEGKCVLSGDGFSMDIKKGDSVFIPAAQDGNSDKYELIGNCNLIMTTV